MRRTFALIFTLAALGYLRLLPAPAAPLPKALEGVRLTPHFEKGKAIYVMVTAETKTRQTRQAAGAPKNVTTYDRKQTFTMRWLPREQDKAGNWIVGLQLIGVEMESTVDYGDGKQVKKGPTENQGNPLSTLLQELKGTDL